MDEELLRRTFNGRAIRLLFMQTHYRKPIDFTKKRFEDAQKTLARWASIAEPNDLPPPESIVDALKDDLNTPKAVADMHRFAKEDPRALFAAMRFLALIG